MTRWPLIWRLALLAAPAACSANTAPVAADAPSPTTTSWTLADVGGGTCVAVNHQNPIHCLVWTPGGAR